MPKYRSVQRRDDVPQRLALRVQAIEMASPRIPFRPSKNPSAESSLWAKAVQLVENDSANEKPLREFRIAIGQCDQVNQSAESINPGTSSDTLTKQSWREVLEIRVQESQSGVQHSSTSQTTTAIMENVVRAKDAITLATSFEPHAAMAWSGVSFLFSVSAATAALR